MKDADGIVNAKNAKPPSPKASPKDFEWPSQRDMNDVAARKIGASLQELLIKREWTHADLARELYGVYGKTGQPRNIGTPRRWVVAEHPIPNEETAGYIAQVLDVSMARLMEPEGKFSEFPSFIRGRSDSKRFSIDKVKAKGAKTPAGRDREKQRAYNAKYRAKRKEGQEKRKYTRKAFTNGNGAADGESNVWVLANGLPKPEYQFASNPDFPGHLKITINATVPHPRAMAILHMLEHQAAEE